MGVKHTHKKFPPFFAFVMMLSENDLHAQIVTGKLPRSAEQREQTQRQGSALTRGERGKKEPESIFKHFIVPAWEVTPKPPHTVRDKRPSKRILH